MDPIDKVKILNSLEESNANRLQKIVNREAIASKQTPSTVYVGQSDDGRSLVKPVGGAIVPLRTIGNVQASVGTSIRAAAGGADAGTNILRQGIRPRSSDKIDLKILASGVDASGTHIFIGGDRVTPTEILVLPPGETISFSRIENLGVGADRWIVALKTTTSTGAFKIYTKFGETPSSDWQLQDIKARILNYFGQGFWSGLLEKPPITFDTKVLPDTVANSLTFFFDFRPGEVRGFVNCGLTEEEFWNVQAISKSYRLAESRGFKANTPPEWTFTGTNTLDSSTTMRAYWLGDPPLSPQFYPFGNSIFLESVYRQDLNLTTQYPSFFATNGTIQTFSGSYVYTEHRESMSTYLHRRYAGLDIPPPAGSNYNIGFDDYLTISTTIQIGLTVSKPLSMVPAPRANFFQDPRVQFDIPVPIENFEGGLFYSKFVGIATFRDDAYIFGGFENIITSSQKQYLRLQDGTEKEAKFSYSYRNYANNYLSGNPGGTVPDLVTWRTGNGLYPTLRDIGNLPANSSQYTPAVSPLLKERWSWTVSSTQPVDNAGVIDYTAPTVTTTEKTVKTYAVTLADSLTEQRILDAR